MKQKVYEFLKQHGGSAPALAIASSLFHLRGGSLAAAEMLLQKALGDDPRFGHDGLGNWYLLPGADPRNDPHDFRLARFCVFAMRPDHRLWAQAEKIWLGRADIFEQAPGKIVTQVFWRPDSPAETAAKLQSLLQNLSGETILVASHPARIRRALQFWAERGRYPLPALWELNLIYLAQNILRLPKRPTLETILERLDIPIPADEAGLAEQLQAMASALAQLLQAIPEPVDAIEKLLRLGERPSKMVNFAEYAFSQEHIRSLPEQPGLYMMKNAEGEVVYIGQTNNLRRRLSEYFLYQSESTGKLARILPAVKTLEWQTVDTELDAVILEARLIRQYRPTVNVQQQIFPAATPQTSESCRILILLSRLSTDAVVYLLSPQGRFERVVCRSGRKPKKKLLRLLQSLCYTNEAGKTPGAEEKMACELAWRWFLEYRDKINWLDAADFGSAEECLQNLMHILDDFEHIREKQIVRGQ